LQRWARRSSGIKPEILVERPKHGVDVGSSQQQRVAIRLRAGGGFGADPSPGAGKILNDHVLSKSGRERLAINRATTSVGPPGENGTTILIGRSG
jgi:hypothetical protein